MEDGDEQPGEDHRPASGPRHLRKREPLPHPAHSDLIFFFNLARRLFPFFNPGCSDSVSCEGTGSALQTEGRETVSAVSARLLLRERALLLLAGPHGRRGQEPVAPAVRGHGRGPGHHQGQFLICSDVEPEL